VNGANLKEKVVYMAEPPVKCGGCGITVKNMEKRGKKWLVINPGIAGILYYVCGNCFVMHVNRNVIENSEKVKERLERRIIVPEVQVKEG